MKTFENDDIFYGAAQGLYDILADPDNWESVKYNDSYHIVQKGPVQITFNACGQYTMEIA